MKNIFRLFTIMLLISIVLTIFASCKNRDDATGEKVGIDIKDYKIIRVDSSEQNLTNMTVKFKKSILNNVKAELTVKTDFVKRDEELDSDIDKNAKEILIGDTNRTASKEALDELSAKGYKNGYIIKATENKIVIVGTRDSDTIMGLKYFINTYVLKSEKENILPMKVGDTFSKDNSKIEFIYTFGDCGLIAVEERTTVFTPPNKKLNEACTYGKIIKLQYQSDPKNNGILLATKENNAYRSIASNVKYPIMRSNDDGASWEEILRLEDLVNKTAMTGYQPYFFELPEDVGEYKKGTILFACCNWIVRNSKIGLPLMASTDCGTTWKAVGNIAAGGVATGASWESQGIWEPVLAYENGRVYCFYSDELLNGTGANHEGGHCQRLVYRYTDDLKTWSDAKECMADENPDSRPGMVALTKMGNGKWALVFEAVSMGNTINIKFADSLDSWDVADPGIAVQNQNGNTMNGSPAISWTPLGGENGILFVTARTSSKSNTKCDLYMSFNYGETFVSIDNPIDLSHTGVVNLYCGYSAGMFVDKDGTLYYVNNPQSKEIPAQETLEFVRIKIYE